MIVTLAIRNLFRHKGKSLVIGAILFLGAFVMTIGNAVVSGMNHGMTVYIRQQLTGDLVILAKTQPSDNLFFSPLGESVEPIPGAAMLASALKHHPKIAGVLPVAKGVVTVLNGESEPTFQMVLGVDFGQYSEFFPKSLTIIEGQYPHPTQRALAISVESREALHLFANLWPTPPNIGIIADHLPAGVDPSSVDRVTQLVYMGYSDRNTSLDIIAPIKMVFKFSAFNGLFGKYSLLDKASYNDCMGYTIEPEVKVGGADAALLALDESNLDAVVFGDSAPPTAHSPQKNTPQLTDGTNAILVKLNPGISVDSGQSLVASWLTDHHYQARVVTWRDAIGQVAGLAFILRGILFGFVMVVFGVAIIMITNTLSLAAMERVSELGMMRAIGAQRRLIGTLFAAETALLTVGFGGFGMMVGGMTVWGLRWLQISANNEFIELCFGGPVFSPHLTETDWLIGMTQLGFVGAIAALYPILVARRITPLDAIRRE